MWFISIIVIAFIVYKIYDSNKQEAERQRLAAEEAEKKYQEKKRREEQESQHDKAVRNLITREVTRIKKNRVNTSSSPTINNTSSSPESNYDILKNSLSMLSENSKSTIPTPKIDEGAKNTTVSDAKSILDSVLQPKTTVADAMPKSIDKGIENITVSDAKSILDNVLQPKTVATVTAKLDANNSNSQPLTFIKINNKRCTGCGRCVKKCPAAAIRQTPLSVSYSVGRCTTYMIDSSKCTKCGVCINTCLDKAILYK